MKNIIKIKEDLKKEIVIIDDVPISKASNFYKGYQKAEQIFSEMIVEKVKDLKQELRGIPIIEDNCYFYQDWATICNRIDKIFPQKLKSQINSSQTKSQRKTELLTSLTESQSKNQGNKTANKEPLDDSGGSL